MKSTGSAMSRMSHVSRRHPVPGTRPRGGKGDDPVGAQQRTPRDMPMDRGRRDGRDRRTVGGLREEASPRHSCPHRERSDRIRRNPPLGPISIVARLRACDLTVSSHREEGRSNATLQGLVHVPRSVLRECADLCAKLAQGFGRTENNSDRENNDGPRSVSRKPTRSVPAIPVPSGAGRCGR